jgi:hydroxymethylpyrimidine/phosphomethylpyrimidine kinase
MSSIVSPPPRALGRVLIIAGSDSSGGAGVQADIKTVTMLGGYAATAITAITVQNTLGVTDILAIPAAIVSAQARAVLTDIGADAVKTGMLGDAALVEAVALLLDETDAPCVVDPVMVAKGGSTLLPPQAVEAVRRLLVPRAGLLTPNAPEAAVLTGLQVDSTDDLRRAGEALLAMGAKAVLMKGGHIEGETLTDILMTPQGETTFSGPRYESRHTHGTGCTLASACAVGLAQGMSLQASAARAWGYVREAIIHAPGLGAGHGPLGHGWPLLRP